MAGLVLLAFLIVLLPFTTDVVSLTIVLMAMGFAIGLSGPIAAWITDVTAPKDLGGAMGLFRTMGDLGFVIAPVALASLAGQAGAEVGVLPFVVAGIAVVALSMPLLRTRDPVAEARKENSKTV
jgi:MFS family permease